MLSKNIRPRGARFFLHEISVKSNVACSRKEKKENITEKLQTRTPAVNKGLY